MGRGIDYGMGGTNIDKDNGIRYGVIPLNDVLQAWADSAEADYGAPTCGKCGNEAVDIDAESVPDLDELDGTGAAWDREEHYCEDYACLHCKRTFGSDNAHGDEPECWYVDDGEYTAVQDSHGDIFITKSPYFTRAAFCSPCAPGACHLMSPCEDGEKAYCFGHDWFEDGKAPYPVYRVSDDTLVGPE